MTWYLGCWATPAVIDRLVDHVCQQVDLQSNYGVHFPVIVKSGTNEEGNQIDFIFNYSDQPTTIKIPASGTELRHDQSVAPADQVALGAWDVKIIERKN